MEDDTPESNQEFFRKTERFLASAKSLQEIKRRIICRLPEYVHSPSAVESVEGKVALSGGTDTTSAHVRGTKCFDAADTSAHVRQTKCFDAKLVKAPKNNVDVDKSDSDNDTSGEQITGVNGERIKNTRVIVGENEDDLEQHHANLPELVQTPKKTQVTRSVYFDTASLDHYRSQILHAMNSTHFRYRTYGNNKGTFNIYHIN